MTKLESIIHDAKMLQPSERAELMRALERLAEPGGAEGDDAVGQRGLAYLTQSTAGEDWSAFYPENLRRSGRAFNRPLTHPDGD